jgi:chromosome segregation ATPase
MNKEYHGRNVALAGMREHAEPNRQGEAVWRYCERRIVRIHASKNKRIEILKAHVLRVEKVCSQKNAYIDKLNMRIGRRNQTINRQASLIERQTETIDRQQAIIDELKRDLTTMNERYEAIDMEMAEVLQRIE